LVDPHVIATLWPQGGSDDLRNGRILLRKNLRHKTKKRRRRGVFLR